MVFFQIVIGGITRLTGSGLSITEWDIVMGTFPPLSSESWLIEFDKYKLTPQYEKINDGMSLSEFKWIYFWEYIHRLWARLMGFVFLIPCIFFVVKRWIDLALLKKLALVILSAMVAATFGWIMVASGLLERPWVNAYKLALHLCIGLLVYSTLFYCFIWSIYKDVYKHSISNYLMGLINIFLVFLIVQLFVGGVMSGMKAGLFYPTWPDMNGEVIPQIVFNASEWNADNFNNYDQNTFMPALVQFIHRTLAYVLVLLGIYKFIKVKLETNFMRLKSSYRVFLSLLITQVVLGIITVLMCKGTVPLTLGVLHQGVAVLLLTSVLYIKLRVTSK